MSNNNNNVLTLNEFGVAFNKKVILSSVTLEIPDTGVMVLMGPSGTGKSTLINTLAGVYQANPGHKVWGQATYAGEELFSRDDKPVIVGQKSELSTSGVLENIISRLPERSTLDLAQQKDLARRLLEYAGMEHLSNQLGKSAMTLGLADRRQLSILALMASNPRLLFVDEPTTGLDEDSIERMLEYVKKEAEKRAIVFITHNQKIAKKLGGKTALIAGGWIQEVQDTEDFFNSPISDVTKKYVRTGGCSLPSPSAKPEDLNDEMVSTLREVPKKSEMLETNRDVNGSIESPENLKFEVVKPENVVNIKKAPRDTSHYKSHVFGPNGFVWIKKGRLAGTPKPGLIADIEQDLKALKRVDVSHLISLTEKPIDNEKCQALDIDVIRAPFPDMTAPSCELALDICELTKELLDTDNTVAMHCRAGLGRTGTMLACQLLYEGTSAQDAIKEVRRAEPRMIQSDVQVEFLHVFEEYLVIMGVTKHKDKQMVG